MEHSKSNKIDVIFSCSKEDLKEIKNWLVQEDKENKSGFYCNWNVIKDLFSKKHFSCIKLDGNVIGFLTWFRDVTDPIVKIAITEIMPAYRSKGFGKILVNECLHYFSSFGVHAVELDCSPETSKPFWMQMGFQVFPNGFFNDSEYHLYRILTNSIGTVKNNTEQELIELWSCEPYEAGDAPRWRWEVVYDTTNEVLTKPIINPAHYDWRIRWRKGNRIFRDDKVKYFFHDREKDIYHCDFIIINELPESNKDI